MEKANSTDAIWDEISPRCPDCNELLAPMATSINPLWELGWICISCLDGKYTRMSQETLVQLGFTGLT